MTDENLTDISLLVDILTQQGFIDAGILIEQQAARIAELEKCAARYELLQKIIDCGEIALYPEVALALLNQDGNRLDAALYAAIAKEKT